MILVALAISFAALKFAGIISWSLVWVLSPIWIGFPAAAIWATVEYEMKEHERRKYEKTIR